MCKGRVRARAWSVFGILLFSLVPAVFASPEVALRVGFDEQVLRLRYAPFQIEIAGLGDSIQGQLIVEQTRGLPGARQHQVTHIVAEGTLGNGIIEATLPVMEPLNPIRVILEDQHGAVLAERVESLRLNIRDWTFPVIVGEALHIEQTEAIIDASELPADWWAYDTADSVWLVEPVISATKIEALGDWVVSGGSVVLFSGADFPMIDSPVLRELMPVREPRLRQLADGTYILEGTPKERARVVATRSEDALCWQQDLGAGSIAVVSLRMQDLTDEEVLAIHDAVPSAARVPAVERMTFEALRSTVVPRPSYLVTPLLGAALLVGLLIFARFGPRRKSSLIPVSLMAFALGAAVWSGFYANQNKTFIALYDVRTSVHVLSSFGTNIAWHTLYSTAPIDVTIEHPDGSYPLPSAVPTVRGVMFSSESEIGASRFTLQQDERRDVRVNGKERLDIRASLDGSRVEVANMTREEIPEAYAFVGEEVYRLDALRPGTFTYSLEPTPPLLALSGMLRTIQDWLPLKSGGLWLLILHDEEVAVDDSEETHRKVRHVTMRFVEGAAS